jgi:hypothetical protein
MNSPPNNTQRTPKSRDISEYEAIEVFALLTDDDLALALALTYDYNLGTASAWRNCGGCRSRHIH